MGNVGSNETSFPSFQVRGVCSIYKNIFNALNYYSYSTFTVEDEIFY